MDILSYTCKDGDCGDCRGEFTMDDGYGSWQQPCDCDCHEGENS